MAAGLVVALLLSALALTQGKNFTVSSRAFQGEKSRQSLEELNTYLPHEGEIYDGLSGPAQALMTPSTLR